jgi:hypothetical protein
LKCAALDISCASKNTGGQSMVELLVDHTVIMIGVQFELVLLASLSLVQRAVFRSAHVPFSKGYELLYLMLQIVNIPVRMEESSTCFWSRMAPKPSSGSTDPVDNSAKALFMVTRHFNQFTFC